MTVEEASGPPAEIWPDNVLPVNVFLAMSTQWRIGGMGTPTGLDYGVFPVVSQMAGVPAAEQPAVFEDLRVLERAALEVMRKSQ